MKRYHLIDGKAFTVPVDNPGQDVKIFTKETNDLWVGHRFAEWGSQNVTDLAGKIATLRQQGITLDQINSTNLPGTNNYNGQLLNASLPLQRRWHRQNLVLCDQPSGADRR